MLIITGNYFRPRPYVPLNRSLILTDWETPTYVMRLEECLGSSPSGPAAPRP